MPFLQKNVTWWILQPEKQNSCIFWFRRDLRLEDNRGLFEALRSYNCVQPIFIFDTNILKHLANDDRRLTFIYKAISKLKGQLNDLGSDLRVYSGKPGLVFKALADEVSAVICNHDYEPYARDRDERVGKILAAKNVNFFSYKDIVLKEKHEVVKDNGDPYVVFTPYYRRFQASLEPSELEPFATKKHFKSFAKVKAISLPKLADLGFTENNTFLPRPIIAKSVINKYDETRDMPAINGTSRLGVHLRFGTLSIRKLMAIALHSNEVFFKELVWREFYQSILYHFPQTVDSAFKPAYDNIPWRSDKKLFKRWCEGNTGYLLVDAGMRQLNTTGYMHNRVRMVVASFLCKHLLIDWRWGERYFAEKLLDFDLAANVGGWQWAAGCGCDAAPYFRVFNPELQQKKFDPEKKYIAKWVSEFKTAAYAKPVVDHKFARERALATYKAALAK